MKNAVLVALVSLVPGLVTVVTPQAGGQPLRIAVIGKSQANPVFAAAHRGAQDTAKSLGAELGRAIEVAVLTPDREDTALQMERLAGAVREGFDAVLIAPTDSSRMTPAINQAVEFGVAVMTFDNDAPSSKRFAHYGPNDVTVGRLVMKELATQLEGTGKVALLAGNEGAANLQARLRGVQQAAGDYPGIELIGPFYHEEKAHVAASLMLEVNRDNPDLRGWAAVGGWPLFRSSQTLALVGDLTERKLKVVGVDALPEELLYVDKGLAVLMAQPVYEWGAVGVTTIVDKLLRKASVPEHIEMKLVRVGRENLADWARQLRDWGFQIDPSAYE
ncbi:MAG: substrate-binding domain-containing protein [Acidobacteriota bacterium]|jgi:ribose transport system substrate-binding protein